MKKLIIFQILTIVFSYFLKGQSIAINDDGTPPASSAILDLQSSNKGFLIPRMNASDRDNIPSPTEGLTVYVIDDNEFYYYDGSQWKTVNRADHDWLVKDDTIIYRIDGRVAIGTNNPLTKFEVFYPTKDGALYRFDNHVFSLIGVNDPSNYAYKLPYIEWRQADYTRAMYIGWGNTNSASNLYLDMALENGYDLAITGGYVGIGTTNPNAELEIKGTLRFTSNTGYKSYLHNTNASLGNFQIKGAMGDNDYFSLEGRASYVSDGRFIIMTGDNGNEPIIFKQKVPGTEYERMRIHKNGYVGIGNANPYYRLDLPNSSGTPGSGRAYAWITYSDLSISKNIDTLNYGLDEILKLQPKRFLQYETTYQNEQLILSDKNSENFGLIAQEVYKIIPEAVYPPQNNNDLWGIDYCKIVPILIKAIQEQQAEIEQLKKELKKLQSE